MTCHPERSEAERRIPSALAPLGILRFAQDGILRRIRKHRLAFLLLGIYLFILFFPTFFMGRVLSPNDVYYHYGPWAFVRYAEAQNPLIHDPPASYVTLMSLLKSDPGSFHWNRYVASGIPGFGSAAAAVLSPFIFLPTLFLPLWLVYSGIVVLKLLAGFALAYWWLREERLGKRGAAVGALLFTAAAPYVVWWLWQGTNATVLYPAVLVVLSRMVQGKRNSITLMALLVVSLLLSGFPATVAYVAWLAALHLLYLLIRERRVPVKQLGRATTALLLGVALSAPLLAPLVAFVRRSGYLALRERAGYDFHFPLDHFGSFLNPYRLGDPAIHLWLGDSRLGVSNNFIEATVYLGLAALVLVPMGLFARRARHRWFWAATLLVLLACMFGGHHPLKDAIGELPGLKYTPLTRLRALLPLPAAYLAAAAITLLERRRVLRELAAGVIGLIVAVDLALFAGRFFPFIRPVLARIPSTATIEFLRAQPQPFRIAPFFDYLWPNSAELMRLEDVRSHFGSEERYRDLLRRFDPGSWGGSGTVIQFHGLRADISDPVLAMLNVRYLVEQPNIDIIRWRVLEKSAMSGKPVGEFRLKPGVVLTRQMHVDADDLYAIDLNFAVARTLGADPHILVQLIRPETGRVVFSRRWSGERLKREPKVYVPLWPYARNGHVLLLRIRSERMEAVMPTTGTGNPLPLLYGKVRTPVILFDERPDGRLFQNLAELPRHWAVWNVRSMPATDLASGAVDFAREAVLTGPVDDSLENLGKIAPWTRRVKFRLLKYSGSHHVLEAESAVPFLLATSEKLTPELRIRIDGRTLSPVEINGLFAGVRVRAGPHRIELTRRIGRGWWLPAFVAGLVWLALAVLETRGLILP